MCVCGGVGLSCWSSCLGICTFVLVKRVKRCVWGGVDILVVVASAFSGLGALPPPARDGPGALLTADCTGQLYQHLYLCTSKSK
jgi:hypothetical protein